MTHPLQHDCSDCKGTGVYQGIGKPQDCPTCGGQGALIGIQVDLDAEPPIYPEGTKKEDWDEMAKAFEKAGAGIRGGSVTEVKAVPKAGMSPVRPIEGDVIHVYDAGWYEAVVDLVYNDARCQGGKLVKADHTCGTFRIPINDICWNVTENRWEHIRHGTPVW